MVVHPFMTHRFYCGQHCTQECAWAHLRRRLPLVVLAWETFREVKCLGGKKLEISLGCYQAYPWGTSTPPQGDNQEGRVRCLRW